MGVKRGDKRKDSEIYQDLAEQAGLLWCELRRDRDRLHHKGAPKSQRNRAWDRDCMAYELCRRLQQMASAAKRREK